MQTGIRSWWQFSDWFDTQNRIPIRYQNWSFDNKTTSNLGWLKKIQRFIQKNSEMLFKKFRDSFKKFRDCFEKIQRIFQKNTEIHSKKYRDSFKKIQRFIQKDPEFHSSRSRDLFKKILFSACTYVLCLFDIYISRRYRSIHLYLI